jgi:hypothetical protein
MAALKIYKRRSIHCNATIVFMLINLSRHLLAIEQSESSQKRTKTFFTNNKSVDSASA